MEDEVHTGHRQRMIKKLTEYPDSLSDHELLEVALYNFLPRVDTNPIAHRLLNVFGSLEKVFSAKLDDLSRVLGLGEKTAEGIVLMGTVLRAILNDRLQEDKRDFSTAVKTKENLCKMFVGEKKEKLIVVLLDVKYQCISQVDFGSDSVFHTSYNLNELIEALSVNKPFGVILCHNHPSGCTEPSDADDNATKKVMAVCSMHGVNFIDHLIICKNKMFSYFSSGKIENLKRQTTVDCILSKLEKENENGQS